GGVRGAGRLPGQAAPGAPRGHRAQRHPAARVSLLVVGSIALDTLEGPYGRVTDELGGSAVYFALAASLVGPVAMVAPVGQDAVERVGGIVADRGGVWGRVEGL